MTKRKKKTWKDFVVFPVTFHAVDPEGRDLIFYATSFKDMFITISGKYIQEPLPTEQGLKLFQAIVEQQMRQGEAKCKIDEIFLKLRQDYFQ